MTLETFWKIRQINDNVDLTDEDRGAMSIAAICGVDIKSLPDLPMREYERLSKAAQAEIEILSVMPSIKPSYMINGTECRLMIKPEQMSMLQFSNLIRVFSSEDIDYKLATILSFLLVPVGFTYPDYNRLAVEEDIVKHIDVRDALVIVGELEGVFMTSHVDTLISSALTQVMAWTDVPRWRRSLARMILMILIRPKKVLGVNGHGKDGPTLSPQKPVEESGQLPKGLGLSVS